MPGASIHGCGEAGTSCVTVVSVPRPPRKVTSLSPSVCRATPLAEAPKFLPSRLESPARGTDADGKAPARKAFPVSCAFGKLAGPVWLCLGEDGKPIPDNQTFYYRLFWGFPPLFFLCSTVGALEQDVFNALLVVI